MSTSQDNFWRRYGLAVVAYMVPTFPLGYAWHLQLFQDRYRALELYRPEVLIPLGVASMLIQGVIFAWMYPKLFSTRRSDFHRSSIQFFIVFASLAWSFTTLPVAAKYQMSSVPAFFALETGFTVVQFLVVSPLISLAWRDRLDSATS
jgi:hypothetical protein